MYDVLDEENLMYDVWLDDIRPAPPGWVWTKTTADVRVLLKRGAVRRLSLDHDLGSEDAYPLVVWMAEHDIWPTVRPVVHSMNPVGRANMEAVIRRYYPS